MKNSKLYKAFRSFQKEDFHQFEKFLKSPFFNNRKDVIELYQLYRNEPENLANKEATWKKINPELPFRMEDYNLLVSRLFQLFKKFIGIRLFEEDKVKVKFFTAKAFRTLNIEKSFETEMKETKKMLDKMPYRNASYWWLKREMEFEHYDFIFSRLRSNSTNLLAFSDASDTYFLIEKLRQGCLLLSHQTVFKTQYSFELVDAVVQYVETHPECLEISAIAIYYYCYKGLSEENNEQHFIKLRQLILQNGDEFPQAELRDIFLLALNYCIKKLNSGEVLYIQLSFELYLMALQQGFLIENGTMDQFTFDNIVTLALKLARYDWVENFILEYKIYLHDQFIESIFRFNMAKLYYEQGFFEKAMPLIASIDTPDYLMMLRGKNMLLKMYYQLGEFDALLSLISSMSTYLNRKKVLTYHKKHFQLILDLTRKLMNLDDRNVEAKDAFLKELEQMKVQTEKDWFLDRVAMQFLSVKE